VVAAVSAVVVEPGSPTPANVSGSLSRCQWPIGQPITKARPTTRLSGIVPPPGWSVWKRESAESERWSPITHSRPSGT
jgi:hypothetical protein